MVLHCYSKMQSYKCESLNGKYKDHLLKTAYLDYWTNSWFLYSDAHLNVLFILKQK